MNKTTLPTISVIVATFNSDRTIGRCLDSIRSQQYPQDKIEIVIADGDSTDDTAKIAKKYRVKWVSVDPNKQNAEYNKSMGLKNARNEIAAFIDHDNVLPHDKWFLNMVEPFLKQKEVVGVETLRYHYDAKTSLIDRYFALFGAGDPLVWYLGKADRLSYIYDTYTLNGRVMDKGNYYIVCFNENNLTTIGANGFLVKRQVLMDNAGVAPGIYFDMDVNVDLIRNGYNTYAFVKDSILHLTGYGNIWNFLKRRSLFLTQYRFGVIAETRKKVRRYGGLSDSDVLRLIWTVVVCATFVVPLYDSVRGWRKIHDSAWFLHPVLCFVMVILYSFAVIKHNILIWFQKH